MKACRWVPANASESVGIIGHVSKSEFDSSFVHSINSSMGVDLSACARVADALLAAVASASCSRTSPALSFPASAAHAFVAPLHSNSWLDTVHNSRCAGGLLPVCKSISCSLGVGSQGPTGTKRGSKEEFPVRRCRGRAPHSWRRNFSRVINAIWRMLLGGPGNHCASGRRERRSCSSTTSLKASSKVKSSVPSLFSFSRQRRGSFFKQEGGGKRYHLPDSRFRSLWHKRVTFSFSGRIVV